MRRYACAIGTGAFLLFLIQPLVSKILLPWYGGSTSVWTVCMLFFQTSLLVGYVYANVLATRLTPRRQAIVHCVALLVSTIAAWAWFPPGHDWRPSASADPPYLQILLTLAICVGLPFSVLAASSPLLQAWFAQRGDHKESPYWLYSLSNLGSALGLLVFPFVLEPLTASGDQAHFWLVSFSLYAAVMAYCAKPLLRSSKGAVVAEVPAGGREDVPTWGQRLRWLALSAAGSVLLLAVSNQLCQEVAVIPFLWVLPLFLYLLSFTIVFGKDRYYWRRTTSIVMLVSGGFVCWLLHLGRDASLLPLVVGYSTLLLAGCLLFHGELVRSKPGAQYLTTFYVVMSAGGALGGVLVSVLAPVVFVGYWELHLVIGLGAVLAMMVLRHAYRNAILRNRQFIAVVSGLGAVAVVVGLAWSVKLDMGNDLEAERGFYGVLHVKDSTTKPGRLHYFYHGATMHGAQIQEKGMRSVSTCYYTPKSGVGLALNGHPERQARSLKVGVVGMGIGTVAAFAQAGDAYRFYEIDPIVDRIARGAYFSFLADATSRGANVEVVLGDGRTLLEDELNEGSAGFDVLIIDAFTSGAIPIHLLTEECMEVYWRHLREDGILAVHVSNRMLDLRPVVAQAADDFGKQAVSIESTGKGEPVAFSSSWMLVSGNQAFLERAKGDAGHTPVPERRVKWRDDNSDLTSVLK